MWNLLLGTRRRHCKGAASDTKEEFFYRCILYIWWWLAAQRGKVTSLTAPGTGWIRLGWTRRIIQHYQNAFGGTHRGSSSLCWCFYSLWFPLAWGAASLVNILNPRKGWSKCFSPQLTTPLVIGFVLEALHRRLSHHYLWLLFILYHVIVLL